MVASGKPVVAEVVAQPSARSAAHPQRGSRPCVVRAHATAGLLALMLIGAFWSATVVVELWGNAPAIVVVKTAIPWALLVLVPCLAIAALTGRRLAVHDRRPQALAKARRMRLIGLNGVLVLVPAALILAAFARAGRLDATFYAIQAVELIAGALSMALLVKNARDGFRLSGRWAARA